MCFLWVFIVVVSGFLLYGYIKTTKPKNKNDLYLNLLKLLLSITLVWFVSNELVAPIFSPRVSEITITPIFIQSMQPNTPEDPVYYYTIFDVRYDIEMPYFKLIDSLNLRMPGRDEYQNIDLITSLQENNPYYTIDLNETKLSGSFLSYKELNGKIPILIKANSREVKKISSHLIIREKNDLHSNSIVRSNHFWWTHTSIFPIKSTGNDVTDAYGSLIGYGNLHGTFYSFYDIVIKSLTDLEIKGLYVPTNLEIYCDNGVKLDKEFNKYISIDLQPRETKHILGISRVTDNRTMLENSYKFNFTSETECYGQWLKYKELIDNEQ